MGVAGEPRKPEEIAARHPYRGTCSGSSLSIPTQKPPPPRPPILSVDPSDLQERNPQ